MQTAKAAQLGVELTLFVFDLTLLLVVIRACSRKKPPFTGSFYTLYVVQSIAECVSYVFVRTNYSYIINSGIVFLPDRSHLLSFSSGTVTANVLGKRALRYASVLGKSADLHAHIHLRQPVYGDM